MRLISEDNAKLAIQKVFIDLGYEPLDDEVMKAFDAIEGIPTTQYNDQDLEVVESLPSLYPMMQSFEVEALDRVVRSAKGN